MLFIIAEKLSVAKSIASALGASSKADGFYEGNELRILVRGTPSIPDGCGRL